MQLQDCMKKFMANKPFLIEAVVDSLEAALSAEVAGADRLELCSALEIGGITPGRGLMEAVCKEVKIPVFVLIRPRGGDFLYSEGEFETLILEAEAAREAGAAGIVAGMLLANGHLDVVRMNLLCQAASPLGVTFHRAFDRAVDRVEVLTELLQTGCNRLLSSGMAANAVLGSSKLREVREHVGSQIEVMPGGGITAENVAKIAETTGAREFHFSAIKQVESGMRFQRRGMETPIVWVPAPEKVMAIRSKLEQYFEV
jgi:copper homeostasis protein